MRVNTKILSVILPSIALFVIMLAATNAAPCCANPLSQAPLCIESERYITPETCCGDDIYFGKVAGAPKNYDDCILNFYSEGSCQKFSDKCSYGCCMQDDFCQNNVPGILCGGKFSNRFEGLCIKGGVSALEGCQKGCCCPDAKIMLKDKCEKTFNANITQEPDCRRMCSKQTKETIKTNDMPNNASVSTPGHKPEVKPANAKPVAKSKACTDMLNIKECVDANCYWCPDSGCGFDCTACKYQHDAFPDVPDRVCDDLCLGINCGNGFYCNLGRCLATGTPEISMKSFFIIFALILLIVVFIVSSKTKREK